MKPTRPSELAWMKLARLAADAPAEPADVPFGFASRVVAQLKSNRRESTIAAFEWLTVRGLAVALVIFAGSAAFGYETLADVVAGETSMVSGWLEVFPLPE